MNHALIIEHGGEDAAIIKSNDTRRVEALARLCALHLSALRPGARLYYSDDPAQNAHTPMHPEKDAIIDGLRALEFPLPKSEIVIEGEWRRIHEPA